MTHWAHQSNRSIPGGVLGALFGGSQGISPQQSQAGGSCCPTGTSACPGAAQLQHKSKHAPHGAYSPSAKNAAVKCLGCQAEPINRGDPNNHSQFCRLNCVDIPCGTHGVCHHYYRSIWVENKAIAFVQIKFIGAGQRCRCLPCGCAQAPLPGRCLGTSP